jgi:pimeloyl-ACP methyl ester carboxylesterase
MDEIIAMWRNITAPVLWVAAEDSDIPRWLASHPEGEAGADGLDEVRRRIAHVPGAALATVADAGHMLHHDQPARVASVIEPFLAAD